MVMVIIMVMVMIIVMVMVMIMVIIMVMIMVMVIVMVIVTVTIMVIIIMVIIIMVMVMIMPLPFTVLVAFGTPGHFVCSLDVCPLARSQQKQVLKTLEIEKWRRHVADTGSPECQSKFDSRILLVVACSRELES